MASAELLEAIRTRLAKGESADTISHSLQQEDWTAEDITGALALFSMQSRTPWGSDQVQSLESNLGARSAGRSRTLTRLLVVLIVLAVAAGAAQASGLIGTAADYIAEYLILSPDAVEYDGPIVVNDYGVFTYSYAATAGDVTSATKPGVQTSVTYIPAPKVASDPLPEPSVPAPVLQPKVDAPAPTVSLTANVSRVYRGDSATLTWKVSDATSCSSGGFDTKGVLSGSVTVTPKRSTEYKLECENYGTTVLKTVRVAIIGVPVSGGGPAPSPNPAPDPEPSPTPAPGPKPLPDPTPLPTPPPRPSGSYETYPGCERPATSYSRTVYIDPASGTDTGDGSQASPLKTLAAALAAKKIQAGDHVVLYPGDHGRVVASKYNNPALQNASSWIWIDFRPGAVVHQVAIRDMNRWLITGAEVTPLSNETSYLVILQDGKDMVFADGSIYVAKNSSGWGVPQWLAANDGFFSRSVVCSSLLRTTVTNTRYAVSMTTDSQSPVASQNRVNGLIKNNTVKNFSGDGIRPIGSNITIQGNTVLDEYVNAADGDGNHDDGIQSWALNGAVYENLTIDHNWIQETTNPARKFNSSMQGISSFDGEIDNVRVTNNVVLASAYHGIAWYGVHDSLIDHNTVANPSTNGIGLWIYVANGKDGKSPVNTVVSNNIADKFVNTDASPGVTLTNNYAVFSLPHSEIFTAFAPSSNSFNLAPAPGSAIYGKNAGASLHRVGDTLAAASQGASTVAVVPDTQKVSVPLAAAAVPDEGWLLSLWHAFVHWLLYA